MTIEILLFFINIILFAYLIYRERQNERILKTILAAKLSRDVSEFKSAIEDSKLETLEKSEPNEIPLEDMSAEEMLGVLNKK